MKRERKQIALGFVFLPLFACAQGTHLDISRSNRETALLKGPVRRVETDVCINLSSKHEKEVEEYDEAGNLLVDSELDDAGNALNVTSNFYDEDGCFHRQVYVDFEDGFTNDWKVFLRPETRQIAMKNKRNDQVVVRTYSPEKRLLSYRLMDGEKNLISGSRNKWNEKGERTEYVRFDAGKKPRYVYYFKWKENGLIDRERQRYRRKKKEYLHAYEYFLVDDYGNWLQRLMVRYDVTGKKKEKVYEQTTIRAIEYFDEASVASSEEPADSAAESEAEPTPEEEGEAQGGELE